MALYRAALALVHYWTTFVIVQVVHGRDEADQE
jgi:hypothetical protein